MQLKKIGAIVLLILPWVFFSGANVHASELNHQQIASLGSFWDKAKSGFKEAFTGGSGTSTSSGDEGPASVDFGKEPPDAKPTAENTSCKMVNASFSHGFPIGLQGKCIPEILKSIITKLLGIAGSLFFLMFLWGGFQYLTAGGDSKQVGNATTTLRNAAIGVAIVMLSYVIVSNLLNLFTTYQLK